VASIAMAGPRGQRYVMSRAGNDLVRRYLWMAALSAVRPIPPFAPLCARRPQESPAQGDRHRPRHAQAHHLAFAVWKTGRPFNPNHYPWNARPTSSRALT